MKRSLLLCLSLLLCSSQIQPIDATQLGGLIGGSAVVGSWTVLSVWMIKQGFDLIRMESSARQAQNQLDPRYQVFADMLIKYSKLEGAAAIFVGIALGISAIENGIKPLVKAAMEYIDDEENNVCCEDKEQLIEYQRIDIEIIKAPQENGRAHYAN